MKKVEGLSKDELIELKREIGEAFVTNELFHEFGSLEERKPYVMRYMNWYVECVYHSGELYQTEDGNGILGVAYSDRQPNFPKLRMLFQMMFGIPLSKMKPFLRHINEIAECNKEYTKTPYTEILMVCVKKQAQKKGYTRQLVEYAKEMAVKRGLPLLFDTDMEEYANIYQHYGCTLYNTMTAFNGVTRYSLVWNGEKE